MWVWVWVCVGGGMASNSPWHLAWCTLPSPHAHQSGTPITNSTVHTNGTSGTVIELL